MTSRLFVGNLPEGTSDKDLRDEFGFYGNVINIDVKEKKDQNSKAFAFITLEADIQSVNKCVQEFSHEKWRGNLLNVSVARESFMEKLKRERADEEAKKRNQAAVIPQTPISHTPINNPPKATNNGYDATSYNIKPKIIESKKHIFDEAPPSMSSDHHEKFDSHQKSTENLNIESSNHYDLDPSIKIINNKGKTDRKRLVIESVSTNIAPKTSPAKPERPLTAADEKRLKSIQNMRTAYNEKKLLIKSALSHVDKKSSNKIVFDDEGDVIQTNNDEIAAKSSKGKRKPGDDDSFQKKANNKKRMKTTLFDDASDDDEKINFEIKDQFEGESGQKLLELQARYKSDKRFILDTRFIDEEEKRAINEEDAIEGAGNDEKNRQYEIMQDILGTTINRSYQNSGSNDANNKKMPPIKTMLRYDPSRPEHSKFMNKIPEKAENSSKKSKKEKARAALAESEKFEVIPAPEVSQERYYKVNESLKQSMEEKKPFSLLSLFGSREPNENGSAEIEYAPEKIQKSNKKVKNPYDSKEKTPFAYDSSDSEDESGKVESKQNSLPNGELEVKAVLVTENFFFSDQDSRFKDGLDFFSNIKPRSDKIREEIKFVVKKRIQNNLRNDRSHFKKVPRKFSNTNKFKKR